MPLPKFIELDEINKGWSGDKKYRAVDEDGRVYLLRVTNSPRGERYADMFRMQKKVEALGVSMCNPIECGKRDDGYYMLQRFVDGVDAEEAVKEMSEDEQYRLGYEAGEYLRLIHSIPAPEDQPDWEARFNAKIDRKIAMHDSSCYGIDTVNAFVGFVIHCILQLSGCSTIAEGTSSHLGSANLKRDGSLTVAKKIVLFLASSCKQQDHCCKQTEK